MSTEEEMGVEREEARRLAMDAVRFNLGTYLRLESGKFDEEELQFIFPIIVRSPKLILDADNENAVDLRFLDPVHVGKVVVDAETRAVNYPSPSKVDEHIENYEQDLNQSVMKAVVRASGSSLSHLPFPENQYAPIQDILSEVILNKKIYLDQLNMMDEYDGSDKYGKYVDKLVEIDLVKKKDGYLESGDVLNSILEKDQFKGHELNTHQDQLNAAVGLYFEHNVGDFEMIKRTLKPYLAIAGYYYRRALELDELPLIREEDLRKGIRLEYSGREQTKKLFKMSRYLIQLENVGVLSSTYNQGDRYWAGDKTTLARLRTNTDQLGPATNLISPSITEQQTLGEMSD